MVFYEVKSTKSIKCLKLKKSTRLDIFGINDKIDEIDEIDQINKIDKIDEVEEFDEVTLTKFVQIDKNENIDKIDRIDEIDKIDQANKIDSIDSVDKIDFYPFFFFRDKSDLKLPILASFKRLVIYHLGSVAFGSFIIALVQLVRIILAYIERKLAKRTNACGPLLKCCQCCLWCFEKCLKFLNRNAYIMTAIYGYNFCKAAQKAFSLLTSNILRVAAINSVGTFVLFLGKSLIQQRQKSIVPL